MHMDDRRRHARVFLRAYGSTHECTIRCNGGECSVGLIDISPGGARFKHANGRKVPDGVEGYLLGGKNFSLTYLTNVPFKVMWSSDLEFGVAFDNDLDCTVSELQQDLSSQRAG